MLSELFHTRVIYKNVKRKPKDVPTAEKFYVRPDECFFSY